MKRGFSTHAIDSLMERVGVVVVGGGGGGVGVREIEEEGMFF